MYSEHGRGYLSQPPEDYSNPRDRRNRPRVHLRRPVRLFYARFQDFIDVASVDISESGMYIAGTGIQPIGATFEFSLSLTDGFTLIEGAAEVLWVKFDDDGLATGMGVRFVKLAGESARLVSRIVEEQQKESGTPATDL